MHPEGRNGPHNCPKSAPNVNVNGDRSYRSVQRSHGSWDFRVIARKDSSLDSSIGTGRPDFRHFLDARELCGTARRSKNAILEQLRRG